jgi:phosphatidylglycerophosphatase A
MPTPKIDASTAPVYSQSRPFADRLALAISTCGVGLIPFAPGTFGALVGLAIFYGVFLACKTVPQYFQACLILVSLIVSALGLWASNRGEKIFGEKDAQRIVVDEVAGQLISFVLIAPLLVAELSNPTVVMIAGFLLFRAFDIFKPYPIKQLQDLPAGLGVMFDDIVAGIYAAVVLSFLALVAPQLLY